MTKPWKRLKHDEVHWVCHRDIVVKKFALPDGRVEKFGILDSDNTVYVATIALTNTGKVLIARQFRPGPELVLDELPGGSAEPGETPKDAAIRELLEETGYVSKSIELLGVVRKEAYRNGVHHYFIATQCEIVRKPSLDENEFIEVVEINIKQLIANAMNGRMTDPAAVLLAMEKLKTFELQA